MSYLYKCIDSDAGMAFYDNPGCLAPLREGLEDTISYGRLPVSLNYGFIDQPIHPKCAKDGAEVLGFLMDFLPNFERNFPWIDDLRVNMLQGSVKAAIPDKPINELTAREMHVLVMIPRWLGEGSRDYYGSSMSSCIPWTWTAYKLFRERGFNPLVSFIMSYIHGGVGIVDVRTYGDQTPFNHLSPNNGSETFKKYASRMVSLNVVEDNADQNYLEEGFSYWSNIPQQISRDIPCPWVPPYNMSTVFENAGTLDTALTAWRETA